MSTKNNPGRFNCYERAEPDEPMFILLARDPLAPALVELWARLREQAIAASGRSRTSEGFTEFEKVNDANEVANEMREWIQAHRPGKRIQITGGHKV